MDGGAVVDEEGGAVVLVEEGVEDGADELVDEAELVGVETEKLLLVDDEKSVLLAAVVGLPLATVSELWPGELSAADDAAVAVAGRPVVVLVELDGLDIVNCLNTNFPG